MKKGIAVVTTSLLLFVGCTEDKKKAKEQVAQNKKLLKMLKKKLKKLKQK